VAAPLAVVTGASSGIGLELARHLADDGYGLVLAAEDDGLDDAAASIREAHDAAAVDTVQVDLATPEGVEQLVAHIGDRPVDALLVNAGVAVGGGPFIDTDLDRHLGLVALNVTGAVHLTHRIVSRMAGRGEGRVLITSSIAAKAPGPYLSTYSASKAFLYSFAQALRVELAERGVTVTALMPGPTDTPIWERGDMEGTAIADMATGDPAEVARAGIDAMLAGDDHVVPGLLNRASVAAANVLPDTAIARSQAAITKPGSGR
jgi:uncharacterized protein